MKRLHVHVSVGNLADSIRFYTGMFAAGPTVLKEDYAKWMLDDPRMNFAISERGAAVGLNHLGIQVESEAELGEMQDRLDALQPGVPLEEGVACCYAKSEKSWIDDPAGIAWETFLTTGESITYGDGTGENTARVAHEKQGACCIPQPSAKVSACC